MFRDWPPVGSALRLTAVGVCATQSHFYGHRPDRVWLRDMCDVSCGGCLVDVYRRLHPNKTRAFSVWNVQKGNAYVGVRNDRTGSRVDFILLGAPGDHSGQQPPEAAGQLGEATGQLPSEAMGQPPLHTGLVECVCACEIWREYHGSDHAPVWVEMVLPNDMRLPCGHKPPPLSTEYLLSSNQKDTVLGQLLGTKLVSNTARQGGSKRSSSSASSKQEQQASVLQATAAITKQPQQQTLQQYFQPVASPASLQLTSSAAAADEYGAVVSPQANQAAATAVASNATALPKPAAQPADQSPMLAAADVHQAVAHNSKTDVMTPSTGPLPAASTEAIAATSVPAAAQRAGSIRLLSSSSGHIRYKKQRSARGGDDTPPRNGELDGSGGGSSD
eukprot:jgi/Chrzof1/3558/Cz13g00100.t1